MPRRGAGRPPGERLAREAMALRARQGKAAKALRLKHDLAIPFDGRSHRKKAAAAPVPVPPPLTPDLAAQFVKLLNAGVPTTVAFAYCAPGVLDGAVIRRTLAQWTASTTMLDAVRASNGGDWQDLAADKRIDLALDKHAAELAYYLYSHNFAQAQDAELEKLNQARKALMEMNAAGGEGQSGAWATFVKDLVAGRVSAMSGPPILDVLPITPTTPVPVPPLRVSDGNGATHE